MKYKTIFNDLLPSDYIKRHEEFNKRREKVRKINENLIIYWDSIPWWKFWEKPSFEEKRDIIINNWRKMSRI